MSDPWGRPPSEGNGEQPPSWPPGGQPTGGYPPPSGPPQGGWPSGGYPPSGSYPGYGYPPPGSYPGAYPGYGFAPPGPKPSNNLALAILTTLLCCLPLGVVAIVFAAQVDSKWNAGDYQGAITAADNAKKAAIAGIILGFVFIVLYVLLVGASTTSTTGY